MIEMRGRLKEDIEEIKMYSHFHFQMASLESFQLPTLKQLIAHHSEINSDIYGDDKNTQLSLPPIPLISTRGFSKYPEHEEDEEVVDIPIQILDDKVQNPNNLLLLRVPQKNFNKTILHTVLKIRVIDPNIFEKDDNSELKEKAGETNLLTNDLSLVTTKEEILESEKQINGNEKLIELDRSAATYRGMQPSEWNQNSSHVQNITLLSNDEKSLPTNNERTRRRRIRIKSSQAAVSPNSQTRPVRRKIKFETTDTTASIITSRSIIPVDLTSTEYPRGFFLTKSTEEILTTRDDYKTLQSTESSNNQMPHFTFENLTSGPDEMNSNITEYNEEEMSPSVEENVSNVETIPSIAENNEKVSSNTEEVNLNNEEFSIVEKISPDIGEEGLNYDQTFLATTVNTNEDNFDEDSLLENRESNTELPNVNNDYLHYDTNQQDDINFPGKNLELSERNDDLSKTTTEVLATIATAFEDTYSTPATTTNRITSPRRHLRTKIIKRKPVPKEHDNHEDFNSSKRIRLTKIRENFSTHDTDTLEYSADTDVTSKKSDLSVNSEPSALNSETPSLLESATNPNPTAIPYDSTISSFTESPTVENFTDQMTNYKITELDPESETDPEFGNFHLIDEYRITEEPDFSTAVNILDSQLDKVDSDQESINHNETLQLENRNSVTDRKEYGTTVNNQDQYSTSTVSTKNKNPPTISRSSEIDSNHDFMIDHQREVTPKTNKKHTEGIILKNPKATERRRVLKKRKRIQPKHETTETILKKSEVKIKVETPETNLTRNKDDSKPLTIETTTSRGTSTSTGPPIIRKRIVVHRGAKKFSTVTTPSTTTVQSFSKVGDHQNQIAPKRIRTVVRKRPKTRTHDASKDEEFINRKGKKLSLNPEPKIVEDAEEAGSEVNSYRTSSDSLRRAGSLSREPNRSRVRTTTHQTLSSVHPTLRRFTSPARQTLHLQDVTLPSQLNYASADDTAAAYLEHLARLEDQRAEMDDQANRAHELVLENLETTTESGNSPSGATYWRKISTTELPRTLATTDIPALRRRQGQKYYNKIVTQNLTQRPRRPAIIDYDYYEDEEIRIVGKPRLNGKLYVTSRGHINCLDQGNFPHPTSCKKFITCARMVSGQVVGTEYTCPNKLSFDPIGGICNWSAGLGCQE
ncbi:mucin-4 isoform X4 [Leptopilina heterotoma]|uniref:mucin-4 isoform X4 n=1 Tax=Leptopilina heterotoma TaxID=63436 RepID=UPI001CAA1595|nr:mucin-4 isoform X4 [Leptopilina heterotoma]